MAKADIDYRQVLEQLGIQYSEKGNSYVALCPNPTHDDNNPSWHMDKNTSQHYCFSCGFKGNIYTLVYDLTGKGLHKFLGIERNNTYSLNNIYYRSSSRFHGNTKDEYKPKRQHKVKKKLPDLTIEGNQFDVFSNPEVKAYAEKIGMSKEYADYFNITYVKFAIVNDISTFYNRLLFPVVENGKTVSVEGRAYTEKEKPKVLYPKGGTSNTLWNIDNLDPDQPVIVCEGIKDTVKIWQHYSRNVTSTFGSMITNRQKKLLRKYPHIILFPDHDSAGYKMIDDFDEFYPHEFQVALPPEEGQDPNDLTPEELKKVLDTTIPNTQFYLSMNKDFNMVE